MGSYAANLLIGGIVAMLSLLWLERLGLAIQQPAQLTLIGAAMIYMAEFSRFLDRYLGTSPEA